MKIFILDDDAATEQSWTEQLREITEADVEPISADKANDEVARLEERRKAARDKEAVKSDESLFDQADILVVDYDLFNLDNGFLTGEKIAYLARCYSHCGLIVGLNQFQRERGPNYFDLRLRGDMSSFADLNITGNQLRNPGLWKEAWNGFRPWHWPVLPRRLADYRRCKQDIADRMDESILEFFGFGDGEIRRDALEHLQVGNSAAEMTFNGYVDRSENGLRGKDKTDRAYYPGIAAARLAKWLEEEILAAQNLLVDAPHLASRFPSLISGHTSEVAVWNACARMDGDGLDAQSIQENEFPYSPWFSRRVWRWNDVIRNASITEVARPWDAKIPDFLFCEDISAFVPREEVREFVADIAPPYQRRCIVRDSVSVKYGVESVDYWPRIRLAL